MRWIIANASIKPSHYITIFITKKTAFAQSSCRSESVASIARNARPPAVFRSVMRPAVGASVGPDMRSARTTSVRVWSVRFSSVLRPRPCREVSICVLCVSLKTYFFVCVWMFCVHPGEENTTKGMHTIVTPASFGDRITCTI